MLILSKNDQDEWRLNRGIVIHLFEVLRGYSSIQSMRWWMNSSVANRVRHFKGVCITYQKKKRVTAEGNRKKAQSCGFHENGCKIRINYSNLHVFYWSISSFCCVFHYNISNNISRTWHLSTQNCILYNPNHNIYFVPFFFIVDYMRAWYRVRGTNFKFIDVLINLRLNEWAFFIINIIIIFLFFLSSMFLFFCFE